MLIRLVPQNVDESTGSPTHVVILNPHIKIQQDLNIEDQLTALGTRFKDAVNVQFEQDVML